MALRGVASPWGVGHGNCPGADNVRSSSKHLQQADLTARNEDGDERHLQSDSSVYWRIGNFGGAMNTLVKAWVAILLVAFAPAIYAATLYADRASFLAAVGQSITDDYSTYSLGQFTNAQMSAVLGETRYEPLTFDNENLVNTGTLWYISQSYCAGCNGNFKLWFDDTTVSFNGGVYGAAVDIVLHSSRHSSVGDVLPGDTVVPGTVLVEYTDGTVEAITIPADVGWFGPDIFFVGITDLRGIKSMTFGIDSVPLRHFWVIDNLTIAATPFPISKGQCKDGLWQTFGFKNQGECLKFVNTGK